jgi:serine/threonine-protein kinase
VPRSSATQATSTPPPTGWSATVLAGIELQLARFVGPVAKVLVRRAARNQQRVDSLVNELLENIDAAADREAFVKLVLGPGGGTPVAGLQASGPAANASAGPAVSDEDVERAIRLLTVYIGPIAKVVVRRAAAGGASRQQFLDQVAQSLETEAERERFLRDSRSASSR